MVGRYIVLNLTSNQARFADDTFGGIDNDSIFFGLLFPVNEFPSAVTRNWANDYWKLTNDKWWNRFARPSSIAGRDIIPVPMRLIQPCQINHPFKSVTFNPIMPYALRLEPYALNLLPCTLPFWPQPATDPVKTFNPISQFPDPKSQI